MYGKSSVEQSEVLRAEIIFYLKKKTMVYFAIYFSMDNSESFIKQHEFIEWDI